MRPSSLPPALVLITSFAAPITALIASTTSPCAAQCGNNLASTSLSDLACSNADFKSTPAGNTFQNCISCQISSTYVDPITRQSDIHWAIYNLRYALSWCLFAYPNNTNSANTINKNVAGTQCSTERACGAFQGAFAYDSLSLNSSSYGFCPSLPAVNVPHCTTCLQVLTDDFYLTNFVVALDASCQQQPMAGTKLFIDGSLFSTTHVNITSPSAAPDSTYNPRDHGLTLAAKAGIGAAALCAMLAMVGFCIIWQGKRRRRRYLAKHQQETGYSDWVKQAVLFPPQQPAGESPGGFSHTPQSQRPLVSAAPWARREDESPASAMGEKVYFSPYTSQYNSPVDVNDQFQTIGREWPVDRKGSVGGSTGVGGQHSSRSRSREKRDRDMENIGDRIELQDVAPVQNAAPVLLHPGHERGRSSHDQDVKNSNVI
ncbi:hypothetical protein WAI453_005115 [Rhynchosporium graminicola]|uniref:LPXTG-domain-containing protein n=1 Tax=Rhynchosporium graminicola TaxID=2792576 RepID=A0A1E1LAU0_9HELO|nr:uncharacterized protein RCO7_10243 [Rhynchosporium commune]